MENTTQHATEASVGVEPELTIAVRPYDLDKASYYGTRAQLEAEGVVPKNIKWPSGKTAAGWKRDGLEWSLRRVRPEGMKGPMRKWMEGDYWKVSSELPTCCLSKGEHERIQAQRDLEDAARRLDPAYQLAKAVLSDKWNRAYHDKAYRAFKALVPGLIPPKRGRKPKTAEGC